MIGEIPNAATGQCESFDWGCCEGNANNFETQAECESACGVTLAVAADIPAASTWGLILMGSLLLAGGWVVVRHPQPAREVE